MSLQRARRFIRHNGPFLRTCVARIKNGADFFERIESYFEDRLVAAAGKLSTIPLGPIVAKHPARRETFTRNDTGPDTVSSPSVSLSLREREDEGRERGSI